MNEIRRAGHDYVYGLEIRWQLRHELVLIAAFIGLIAIAACSGCTSTGKSYTREAAGLGLYLEPFGSGPNAPRAALGQFSCSTMAKDKDDPQPLLNRIQIEAPFGAQLKATQGAGAVGEELAKAGA